MVVGDMGGAYTHDDCRESQRMSRAGSPILGAVYRHDGRQLRAGSCRLAGDPGTEEVQGRPSHAPLRC